MTLWRYNKNTGSWVFCRDCESSTAQDWLNVWQKDEPNEVFKLSIKKPRSRPQA